MGDDGGDGGKGGGRGGTGGRPGEGGGEVQLLCGGKGDEEQFLGRKPIDSQLSMKQKI